jgi:hypothetical protein
MNIKNNIINFLCDSFVFLIISCFLPALFIILTIVTGYHQTIEQVINSYEIWMILWFGLFFGFYYVEVKKRSIIYKIVFLIIFIIIPFMLAYKQPENLLMNSYWITVLHGITPMPTALLCYKFFNIKPVQ